ncbi:hypothetical protein BJX99DRAFT_64578 [Aspergillus californicus]
MTALQGQNVPFRVKLLKAEQRVYHARRPHRKSREGCAKCKQRRVKCDETWPRCQKCTKLNLECIYEAILPPGCGTLKKQSSDQLAIAQFLERAPSISPNSTAHSLAVHAVGIQIDELLQVKQGKFAECLSNLDTLRHFQDTITPTIISESGREVMRGKMIRLALESPFLMHSIVAVAIAHLRQTLPSTAKDLAKYTLLETHHWQHAIRQYAVELQSPTSAENMDALFSACLLLTINSFAMERNTFNPRLSFVFSDNPPGSLNWLFIQSGLRHLLSRTGPWLKKSMWWDMFMDSRGNTFDDTRSGRDGLHPPLADLCGIDASSTTESNPYLWPLRMLTPLLALTPSLKTFPRITTFMGRLLPDYYACLVRREPPALVLLAWWLSLMLGVDLWWVNTRARSECVAICMYLEDTCFLDPLVLQLLEVPAQACGYLLAHNSLDGPVQREIAELVVSDTTSSFTLQDLSSFSGLDEGAFEISDCLTIDL